MIEAPEEIVRIQRRDFFRVDVKKDIAYRRVEEDEDHEAKEEYIESKTVDLSGGSVRVELESELQESDILEMIINI